MTSRWITAWRVGALMAVAAVAAVNVIHTAQKVPPPAIAAPASMVDPLIVQERRFAAFRENARARGLQGTIGYVGNLPDGDDDYFYAQFVLLPLVLDLDPEPYEWTVANLRTSTPEARLPARWCLVEDFGEGVLLLRKSAAR